MAVIRAKIIGRTKTVTVALTIIGIVAMRCNNPILPAQFSETHIEFLLAALATHGHRTVGCMTAYTFYHIGIGINDQKWTHWIGARIEFVYRNEWFTTQKYFDIKWCNPDSHLDCVSVHLPFCRRFGLILVLEPFVGLLSNKWILKRPTHPEQSTRNRNRVFPPEAYHWRTVDVTSNFCHPSRDTWTLLLALNLICWFDS